jgi:hypothetical protein
MSSPNGSIANLVVARKSPRGAEEVRALRTQLGISLCCSASRIGDGIGSQDANEKSRRWKGAGINSTEFFAAFGGENGRPLLLQARVSRGHRLESVRCDSGIELGNLRRLGDKALVSLLREFALNLDSSFHAARAE